MGVGVLSQRGVMQCVWWRFIKLRSVVTIERLRTARQQDSWAPTQCHSMEDAEESLSWEA